ncbi:MAG: DNA cytosine methyltransferase, partial [Eubacteriales bacterium]
MSSKEKIIPEKRDLLFENHARDCRYSGPLKVSPTLTATIGEGGNNGPIILNCKNEKSCDNNDVEGSDTIVSTEKYRKTGGGNIPLVKQESFCIASNTINRKDKNGGNGKGFQKDIAYTLTQSDIHAVYQEPYQNVVGALMHRDHKGVNTCYVNQDKCIVQPYQKTIGALCSGDWKGPSSQYVSQDKCIVNRNLVRRLTPLECERLQGFPDDWTNIPNASDSPRYKALGNSVAIP